MSSFFGNGKLLLTGEYLVLRGATSLALPTKLGQSLQVKTIEEPFLIWKSFDVDNTCWLEVTFDLPRLRILSTSYNSNEEGGDESLAERLLEILVEAKKLNPKFLQSNGGFSVTTKLDFDKDWGLGSSSTLIANISSWASIDPYILLTKTFGGSGYDIACSFSKKPLFFTKQGKINKVETVDFKPSFADKLFFVYLNKKQNSRNSISYFNNVASDLENEIKVISTISKKIVETKNLESFELLLNEHEKVMATILKMETIKTQLFSDYKGMVKSLGAWGGDFVLATGDDNSKKYFREKGFTTILNYNDLIL